MAQPTLWGDGADDVAPAWSGDVINPRWTPEPAECVWCHKRTRHLWAPVGAGWLCNAAGCGLGQPEGTHPPPGA